MGFIRNMSIKSRMMWLSMAFGLAMLIYGTVAYFTIEKVKVNGPMYAKVVEGKDLVADILPPPEYIIESYLTAEQLADQTDQDAIAELDQKMKSLQKEYDTRHKVWVNSLEDGPMKETLVDRSYQPAIAFYRTYENKFLPALVAGDSATAKDVLHGSLTRHYQAHCKEIDSVVDMANERNATVESRANDVITARTWILIAIAAGSIVLFLTLGQLLARAIGRYVANSKSELAGIHRSQAVIEFNLDGTIITANENFLNAMGYDLSEVQGKHHRIFCDPAFAQSQEYHDFWAKLNSRRVPGRRVQAIRQGRQGDLDPGFLQSHPR